MMFALPTAIPWRLIGLVALLAATVAGYAWWQHRAEQRGAQAERDRLEAVADLQREANRGRARDVEQAHAARTIYRDRFISQTITEVRHAAAPLAHCPVPADVGRLLNAAAECAREDRPTACAAGESMR